MEVADRHALIGSSWTGDHVEVADRHALIGSSWTGEPRIASPMSLNRGKRVLIGLADRHKHRTKFTAPRLKLPPNAEKVLQKSNGQCKGREATKGWCYGRGHLISQYDSI